MSDEIEITRYTCHCYSSRMHEDLVLFLYDKQSNVVGQVFAVPEGEALPPAERRDGRVRMYFRRDAIPQVIQMLRDEGPVFLQWNSGRGAALATGYEPVGEREGG
jgi:hypothetical protein